MKLISRAVFVIAGLVIEKQYCVLSQHSQHVSESEEDFEASLSIEHSQSGVLKRLHNHTFVALIDIVFTDGSKRTCTGTIIHDNVVITAAHCFAKNHDKYAQPELTTSFVVIGSKKMFELGYEQYLPIERVVNHPLYKGWTADIALVYTFAGMMSDKPGTVMPLAGEKMSTPVHTNLTVLSWGRCNNDDNLKYETRSRLQHYKNSEKPAFTSSEENMDNSKFETRSRLQNQKNSEKLAFTGSEENMFLKPTNNKKQKTQMRFHVKQNSNSKGEKVKKTKTKNADKNEKHSSKTVPVTKDIYEYRAITSEEEDSDNVSDNNEDQVNHNYKKRRGSEKNLFGSIFNNWRRSMGHENNDLTVETFGIIDSQACKELVRKAMPDRYKLKNVNEYICYSSEDHYVTDKDAGAPAVRHGHLVGVTVGGVECDDDHVAVGIRVCCFCSWIADNLPDGGTDLKCCDHCCDEVKPPPPKPNDKEVGISRSKKKKSRF